MEVSSRRSGILTRVDGAARGRLVHRIRGSSDRWLLAAYEATELAATLRELLSVHSAAPPAFGEDTINAGGKRPLPTDRPRPLRLSGSEMSDRRTTLTMWTSSARRSRTKLAVVVPHGWPSAVDVRRRARKFNATGRSPWATLRMERSRSASTSSKTASPSRRRRIRTVSSSTEPGLCTSVALGRELLCVFLPELN